MLIADTHVHIYPHYDLARFFGHALDRLQFLAPESARALCLTERFDCHAFRDLSSGRVRLPEPWSVSGAGEMGALKVVASDGRSLLLFAGRQIVTRERIEILCLTADAQIADSLPAADIIATISDSGAIPVLPWAPGKWLGGRGKLVANLFETKQGTLLAGDTSLRPNGWPRPGLFDRASGVIAGSDPLPIAGEEAKPGQYATLWRTGFDAHHPVTALRNLLQKQGELVGRRDGLAEWFDRLKRNQQARK